MRDIALALLLLGLLPFVLRSPWIGALVYAWVSVFVPHRWAYGFAHDMPIAMIVAVTTLVSMALHPKEVRLPATPITVLLVVLPLWMTVTLFFAFDPEAAHHRWLEVMKVFFFTLVTLALIRSREQMHALLWVLVLSVGFYSAKGGIFTLYYGGSFRVYGPPGESAIADNNAIGLASVMMIPLILYLFGQVSSKWVKGGLLALATLSAMTALGSQSRGAFLAIMAMSMFLWMKSRRKFIAGAALAVLAVVFVGFMPENWTSRMQTIESYDQDASAMGRVNTWWTLFNLANDRPFVGGGFEPYTPAVFLRYAPDPEDLHAAHSIYFQMLGEHGYVGLALFLWLALLTWRTAGRLVRAGRNDADFRWAASLARAIQVSLIGFAVGGAFVNMAYWDVFYYEIVILVVGERLAIANKAAQARVAKAGDSGNVAARLERAADS